MIGVFKNGLARNTGALYLVQISNYVIPLIILPYLTRALGKEAYGELVTLQAIGAYGLVITDYGFQISATRKLAAMLERGNSVGTLYAQVTTARLILAAIAIVSTCITVAGFSYLSLSWSIGGALATLVMGSALIPLWLFQGFQNMVMVSVIVLASRLGATLLTLFLVKSSQDVDLALWAQAIGTALPAVFALRKAAQLVPELGRPSFRGVWSELTEGWPVFQTALFSTLLTNSGVLILGAVAGPQVSGGYAAVERVAKGIASLLSPVTQTIYPKVSAAFAQSYENGFNLVRRFGLLLIGFSGFLAILGLAMALLGCIGWLFGEEYQRFAGILFILAPWMILGVVNNFLGIQYLTNVGEQKWYAAAFTISSLIGLALFIQLSRLWSYWGIAWGVFIGEAVLAVLLTMRVYRVHKNRLGEVLQ